MASFVRNSLYLVPDSENTVSFTGTTDNEAVLVAFHPIIQNTISPKPSLSLCPLSNYAIRVQTGNEPSSVQLLAPGSGNDKFNLTAGFVSDPSQVVLFQPLDPNTIITVLQVFPAALIVSGNKNSDEFIVKPREDFALVGYTTELPVLLNNCKNCPCNDGDTCQSTGICQFQEDVCPEDTYCGNLNGLCYGPCLSAGTISECRFISGGYTCVPSENYSEWQIIGYILIASAFILIVLYFIFMIYHRENKIITKEYMYETVGPPQTYYQYDGCTVQSKINQQIRPVVEPVEYNHYTIHPISTVATTRNDVNIIPRDVPLYEARPYQE